MVADIIASVLGFAAIVLTLFYNKKISASLQRVAKNLQENIPERFRRLEERDEEISANLQMVTGILQEDIPERFGRLEERDEEISANLQMVTGILQKDVPERFRHLEERDEEISVNLQMRFERLEKRDKETSANLQMVTRILQEDIPERFRQLEERDEEISANLQMRFERLDAKLQVTSQTIENISKNVEISDWVANLRGEGWELHLERVKRKAIDYEPRYISPQEGKRILTESGRQLLDSKTTNRLENLIEANPDLSTNDIILHFDIRALYPKAKEQNVSLDTMIAVVATYIEEVKHSMT